MRVVFMGSPEFAVPTLRALATGGDHEVALVVSQPDKPAGRGAQLTPPAVKVAADALGLPTLQPKSARTGELEAALKASGAEVAIVVAYGKILPKPVLDALPRGCLNVHGSLLPKYRGAAPVQWAVIDGERTTGISIMQLDEGMDTGPVLLEREVAIGDDETSGELLARLAPIGAIALVEALAKLDALKATPQDHAEASHARMLTKADGAIDFTQAPDLVAARIRGVDPWPGARAMLRGETLKLFRATMTDGTAGRLPGTVIAIDTRGVHVSCKGGVIAIRELQAPGRKRMTAQQFAAGRGIEIGDKLDTPVDEAPAKP